MWQAFNTDKQKKKEERVAYTCSLKPRDLLYIFCFPINFQICSYKIDKFAHCDQDMKSFGVIPLQKKTVMRIEEEKNHNFTV
jgi:hypothetical protein